MQKKTLKNFILFAALIVSANVFGQTWYWTKQADSSSSQTASQVAVDRNKNPAYTGYFSGTRMAFGTIGLSNLGFQSDFLVKYSSAGTPLWTRNATALTTSTTIYGISVATDRNNDILESGYFDDSIAFGPYHLTAGFGSENTYLAKYDPNGNVLWATSAKIPVDGYYNQNYSVTADNQNNIYMTGYFEDTVIFGPDTLTSNSINMYLVKYNSAGKVIWARAPILGVSASTYGLSVAADDSGNAYVAGNITDSATFGNIKTGNTGTMSVYIAKYDSTGKAKWVQNTTATPGSVLPTPVVVDRTNNVYLGAQFTNASINFGRFTVTDGASPSCSNALLVKYNPNGGVIWATCADFISVNEVCVIIESAVTTDRCNNVYWSGLCSDTFGVGNVKVTIPGGGTHQSTPFAYVIKLDSNANPIAGAALRNQNANSFSNYLACDSDSKVLFASELVAPANLIVGSDTVHRYLTNSTCFLSKFAVIPTIANSKSNDSICQGDSILLSITSVPGTSYTWNTGAKTDSISVKPSITTTYYVVSNNGCIKDTSFITVTVTPNKAATITGKDSICKGDTLLLIAGGGGTYKWSTLQTTDTIKVSPGSNTTYTLTSYNGNCSRDTTFTVNVIPTPTAVITARPDTICQGDSALLLASGGTSYIWSNGKTTTSIWVKPDSNITYVLHALSSKCVDSATIIIHVQTVTKATITTTKDSVCPNGSATISVTGTGGNVRYKWSTGATGSSIIVNLITTTTYTATVYGTCDSVKKFQTIIVIPNPVPVIKGTPWKCKGQKDTLYASGGTTYKWSNGSTSSTYYTGNINADSTITLTAYNSLGCSHDTTFSIVVRTGTVTVNPGIVACSGTTVELKATTSGTGPFSFKWSPGGATTDSIFVADTASITYTVSILENGCITTETTKLTPYNPPLTACCSKVILLGDDTVINAYGKTIVKYKWEDSNEVNCLNPPLCNSVKVSPTVTTTYTVIATDSAGCQTEQIITIIVETPCFNFIVPNVFTPDYAGASGLNNVFYIKTENITGWSIYIYDRWGKEMFKSTNPDVYWTGETESGGKAPDGVYYYIISGTCRNNTYKKDGFLQLIR